VELPNREKRLSEPPSTSMVELVREICADIASYLDLPFSFFGHSMGALICFELARTMSLRGLPQPQWVFVSASVPPHRIQPESLHTLPLPAFIESVSQRYSGLPVNVLASKELLEVFMPILRADFELIERYRYAHGPPLVDRIAAFGGRQDASVPRSELERWCDLTRQSFRVTLFDGDHFFLNVQRTALLKEICDTVSERATPETMARASTFLG
jgi:medium-chain acyl-[acyl-carrier-protein] hydrolase